MNKRLPAISNISEKEILPLKWRMAAYYKIKNAGIQPPLSVAGYTKFTAH